MRKKKLPLNDSDRLVLFCFRFAELQATRYYREFTTKHTCLAHGTVVFEGIAIDEELFVSFLVAYRLFHEKGEPTYMGGKGPRGISDIIREVLANNPELSARVTAIDAEFSARAAMGYQITGEDGKPVKTLDEKAIFHLWMDSRYFHSDVEGLQFFYQLSPKVITASRGAFEVMIVPGNTDRMRYHRFRCQHLFVGSGVIEAGCKKVIGSRLKQSGMFWTVRGANAIMALRCCHLNARFEDYWEGPPGCLDFTSMSHTRCKEQSELAQAVLDAVASRHLLQRPATIG